MSDYRLARILHPDSSHPSASHDNFAILHKAYTLLSHPGTRSMYLQTGYGWSTDGSVSSDESWSDAQMRAEARARRRGGAAAWHTQNQPFTRNRDSWTDGTGRAYEEDFSPKGGGEPRYMTNQQFFVVVVGIVSQAPWS